MDKLGLKNLRKKKGLSQYDAAALCGVCQTTWVLWEHGKNNPTKEHWEKIRSLNEMPNKLGK